MKEILDRVSFFYFGPQAPAIPFTEFVSLTDSLFFLQEKNLHGTHSVHRAYNSVGRMVECWRWQHWKKTEK
jgi:hypothetical protein